MSTTSSAVVWQAGRFLERRERQARGSIGSLTQALAETVSSVNAFGHSWYVVDQPAAGSSLSFGRTDQNYQYDASGALAAEYRKTDWNATRGDFDNYVQTLYGYYNDGQLKSLAHSSQRYAGGWPGYTTLVAFTYGYDRANRISAQGTDWNTAVSGLATRSDEGQTFTYDGAGQLLGDGASSYYYGANGNRTFATESGFDTYNTGSQNRVSSDSTYTYQYDNEGNLIARYVTADPTERTDYTWDHRQRLVEVETSGEEQSLVQYRYDAGDGLVWRQANFDGLNVQTEQYALEAGRRALTLDASGLPPGSPGTLSHRYQYGPVGEAIYDQAFSSLGQATGLLEPLGDHQNSTRVLLKHASGGVGATSVDQTIDYAAFGATTAIKDSAGQATTAALDTVFGHHGSITDGSTGLELKGARWYSTDLGRFISEDPSQDGSNWYEAFGNDPVNFADPTGLSQAGYPLSGSSSPLNGGYGGIFNTPSINLSLPSYSPPPITSTFGGYVGAGLGSSILGSGFNYAPPATTYAAPAYVPTYSYAAPTSSYSDFHSSVVASNNHASLLNYQPPTVQCYRSHLWRDAIIIWAKPR